MSSASRAKTRGGVARPCLPPYVNGLDHTERGQRSLGPFEIATQSFRYRCALAPRRAGAGVSRDVAGQNRGELTTQAAVRRRR